MAAKRLANQDNDDHDQPKEKRMRSFPSFASITREVMMVRSFNTFCNVLEPMLRKVVNEEVERTLRRTIPAISRSPSLRIQAPEPASLKLMFTNKSLPTTFTCSKILDINGQSLQLVLVEQRGHDQVMNPICLPYPIKIEIVAIDGDFPSTNHHREVWTAIDFNCSVVKERASRRPLLAKDLNYTIKGTNCVTLGDIEFTDNSSWVRCRKFKLGARVIAETSRGVRILEALTDAFVVKDHRGELYKKHYPPKLGDEVWRLEKIGKDGKLHKRLTQASICNVQDFLKLSVVNPTSLKKILGGKNGISERMWDAILRHARTCDIGNKLYISSGPNYTIVLDPICQIFSFKFDGRTYSTPDLNTSVKNEVDKLVEHAYKNWDSLQEIERPVNETFQPSQGNLVAEYGNGEESMMPFEVVIGGVIEVAETQFIINNDLPIQFGGWEASPHNLN